MFTNCPELYNYIFATGELPLPRNRYPEGEDYFKNDLGYKRIQEVVRAARSQEDLEMDPNANRLPEGTDTNIYARDVVEKNLSHLQLRGDQLPHYSLSDFLL